MLDQWDPKTIQRITRGEMEHILRCLRFIDGARDELAKKGPGNESIVDELRRIAHGVYEVVAHLPKAE